MNRYGVIAQRHWARWLPRQYAAIGDPDRFFTALGEEVARQIDDLTDELVDEIRQADSYLAHVGRLFAAHAMAKELILPQRVLPAPNSQRMRRMCRRRAVNGRWSWTATTRRGPKWTPSSRNVSTDPRQTSPHLAQNTGRPAGQYGWRGVGM